MDICTWMGFRKKYILGIHYTLFEYHVSGINHMSGEYTGELTIQLLTSWQCNVVTLKS